MRARQVIRDVGAQQCPAQSEPLWLRVLTSHERGGNPCLER
jgi:hypothetical protein